jgi:DNA-binding MarR family transcriptional regulator
MPPLEWYDVVLELEREEPLRPRDLQDRLLLAQYNLSRLLDRMEKEGLISRERSPDDARSQLLRATGAGKALRRRMWPIYAAAIQAAIGDKLSDAQALKLAELLSRIREPRT